MNACPASRQSLLVSAISALILGIVMIAASPAASAKMTEPSIIGMWATGTEGGKVEIYRCGQAVCGRIADVSRLRADPDLRDMRNKNARLRHRKLKGLIILQSFKGGPAHYKGGPVYDPETGDGASRGELKLLPSGKLEVKGCVTVFCRTKIWTRIS